MAFVCNTGHKGAFYMQKIIPVSESGLYIPYKIKLMLVLNNKIHAALFSRYWLNHIITENWTKVELNVHKVCKYNVMLVQQHTWPIALLISQMKFNDCDCVQFGTLLTWSVLQMPFLQSANWSKLTKHSITVSFTVSLGLFFLGQLKLLYDNVGRWITKYCLVMCHISFSPACLLMQLRCHVIGLFIQIYV